MTAAIDDSDVTAPVVTIEARTDALVTAIAAAGAGASTGAGGASVSLNEISNTVEARITGADSLVEAGAGTVGVRALDNATIVALSGAGSGAGTGAGADQQGAQTQDQGGTQGTTPGGQTGSGSTSGSVYSSGSVPAVRSNPGMTNSLRSRSMFAGVRCFAISSSRRCPGGTLTSFE